MKDYFRKPIFEEGINNIILQNRCGLRLTLMVFEDHTSLEFVYKPNAFRRKDYHARNFSNRDNFTTLFKAFKIPQVTHRDVEKIDYDPFYTLVEVKYESLAKNEISFVNLAEDNAFAISAKAPLLLALRPHNQFELSDGLLTETFSERGEEIVSFVAFKEINENRYRVLDNGEHVLQIFENETILVGGEESKFQVKQTVKRWQGLLLNDLLELNEKQLEPSLAKGQIECNQPQWQRVLDLNRRIVYSGIDEGGACFGALNRIYHLIWVRDGAMTTSHMARSGNPDFLKTFAPFLLNNPSKNRRPDGMLVAEFSQIIGSRWSKSEDDGIYYALLSLFTHWITTGDDSLLRGEEFEIVLQAFEDFLEKAWEPEMEMVGSDTLGESPLAHNPYFGFDVVTGGVEDADALEGGGDSYKACLARCYSLYNNVNTYNALLMASILLGELNPRGCEKIEKYVEISIKIKNKINKQWIDEEGYLYSSYNRYTDGTYSWCPFGERGDYWEHAWATSLGPFFPAPTLQLKTARMILERWPQEKEYGFTPWNTMLRFARDLGMNDQDYASLLQPEIDDAMTVSNRYPMQCALGEYSDSINNEARMFQAWRALPFTAGSLFYSVTSLIVHSLPMGIAVRGSGLIDKVKKYYFQTACIDVHASGEGEYVGAVFVNGRPLVGTLQIPSSWLRTGSNSIDLERSWKYDKSTLVGSTAELIDVCQDEDDLRFTMRSTIPTQFFVAGLSALKGVKVESGSETIQLDVSPIGETDEYTLLEAATRGEFELIFEGV